MNGNYFDASYGRFLTVRQELLDERICAFRRMMEENCLDMLFVACPDEGGYRGWLTGTCKLDRFSEGGIWITKKGPVLLVTGSKMAFEEKAAQEEAGWEFNVLTYNGKCMEHKTPYHYYEADRLDVVQIKKILGNNRRIGVVHMPQMRAELYDGLMHWIENLQIIDVTKQADFVKACKSDADVALMESLAGKADRIFYGTCAILHPDMYEREAVNELRNCAYRLGAYGNDDGISTRIHLRSGEINDNDIVYPGKLMKEGETVNLKIHFAGDDSCYGALARSYYLGDEPTGEIRRLWGAAVAAQYAAAQLLIPGSTVKEAADAGNKILAEYGFEPENSSVIAGIGYGIRECPKLSDDSENWKLKENMVLFVEFTAGIKKFSVCCGDMYAVNPEGARRLNRFPQELYTV